MADIPGASLTANTSGGLTKNGAGTLTLSGANTYTGNTVVNDGTLDLAATGQLKFVLGDSSGVNNSISGTTATLKGSFVIDTTAADALSSGTWTLENVASLTGPAGYDATFTVAGFNDAGGNKWTKNVGPKTYTFDETTGVLTLGVASGYASWASTNAGGQTAERPCFPSQRGVARTIASAGHLGHRRRDRSVHICAGSPGVHRAGPRCLAASRSSASRPLASAKRSTAARLAWPVGA